MGVDQMARLRAMMVWTILMQRQVRLAKALLRLALRTAPTAVAKVADFLQQGAWINYTDLFGVEAGEVE